MKLGSCLVAPDGWQSLQKGKTYYLLAVTEDPARVLVVDLWERSSPSKRTTQGAEIIALPLNSFKKAISGATKPYLQVSDPTSTLPPWLCRFEGFDVESVAQSQAGGFERLKAIEATVRMATDKFEEMIVSQNPISFLNAIASERKQNTARYRLQVCLYLVFAENTGVFLSQKFRCGRFDRDALPDDGIKLGRRSDKFGKHYGKRVNSEDKNKIIAGYHREKGLGVARTTIVRAIQKKDYGCKARGGNWKELYHPEGNAFPSARQIGWVLQKEITVRQMQYDRFGAERVRNKIAGNKGSFTEKLGNLLESVESDGYSTAEHPSGITGQPLPKLIVVRLICVVSRLRIGIGFSWDGEKASAYDMAWFCAAIGPVAFCALFGKHIDASQWPNKGWPARGVSDQGAGAGVEIEIIPFQEITPAHAPQSKGVMEGSNPKEDHHSGPPSYLQSALTPNQLAVQEIERALRENDTVAVKLTPRMLAAGVKPTPLGVWKFLGDQGHTREVQVPESEYMKRLLSIDAVCNRDGVQWMGQLYNCPAKSLVKMGLMDLAKQGEVPLKGCRLPFGVRHIWILWQKKWIKLTLSLPIDDGVTQTYLTLEELAELDRVRRENARRMAQHRDAAFIDSEDRHEAEFGRELGKSTRRRGRAKSRSRSAREEGAAVKKVVEGAA